MQPDALSSPPSHGRRPLDEIALARWRDRLERSVTPIWLHAEVARRMGERLSLIKQPARRALIWGRSGGRGDEIVQVWPQTRRTQVELATGLPTGADQTSGPSVAGQGESGWGRTWRQLRDRWVNSMRVTGNLTDRSSASHAALPVCDATRVAPASADLIWSNMGLHLQADPVAIFRSWHQALAIDGFVMFSTLGPGTVPELRALYQREGWGPPQAPLVDMHDLGDMMGRAGLADPVVDQETLTLTWACAADAMAELRGLGANAAGDRFSGLRTPGWRRRLELALEEAGRTRADAKVALTFEVIYGHAFKPPPKVPVAAHTSVALEDMRALARGARRRSDPPS